MPAPLAALSETISITAIMALPKILCAADPTKLFLAPDRTHRPTRRRIPEEYVLLEKIGLGDGMLVSLAATPALLVAQQNSRAARAQGPETEAKWGLCPEPRGS
jgi:hypothetical protein